jgi:cell division protein FtsB
VEGPTLKQLLTRLAIVFAVYFAFQGGEYSTWDLYRQQQRAEMLTHAIDSVKRDVDSLASLKRNIQSDPATQERIAREDFGMVRNKELLFRFLDPDSLQSRREKPG